MKLQTKTSLDVIIVAVLFAAQIIIAMVLYGKSSVSLIGLVVFSYMFLLYRLGLGFVTEWMQMERIAKLILILLSVGVGLFSSIGISEIWFKFLFFIFYFLFAFVWFFTFFAGSLKNKNS